MPKYATDDALNEIVAGVLKSGEFPDAEDMRVKAVFAKGSAPAHKEAASCRKVPAILRLVGDYDFVLVFWTNDWNSKTNEERLVTVCHELWHISQNDEGQPKIRPHGGDFCELPEHDIHSKALAKRVKPPAIMATMPRQITLD
jgi:predicted metallopeptidase